MVEALWASLGHTYASLERLLLRNSVLQTLFVDLSFFLCCVLAYRLQTWLRRRRRRRQHHLAASLESGSPPPHAVSAPLLREDEDAEESRRLPATARNYLRFLRSGLWLFTVLVVVSTVTTIYVWGPELLLRGEALRSTRRTRFGRHHAGCQRGFPGVPTADDAQQCALTRSREWLRYIPLPRDSSADAQPAAPDPRPAGGVYTPADSLQDCEHKALVCGAPALAFGGSVPTRPSRQQCWLFRNVSASALPLEDFVFCRGDQDFVPGVVEFTLTVVYGVLAICFGCRLLSALSGSQKSRFESAALWFTELPRADKEDGEPFMLRDDDFERVARDLKMEIEKKLDTLLKQDCVPDEIRNEPNKVELVAVQHVRGRPRRGLANGALRRLSVGDPRDCADRKGLAGHAFAIMRREAYAHLLLSHSAPLCGMHANKYFKCLPAHLTSKEHMLFKFGQPPWSAVTLRCQRAPPASDILWKNLDVDKRQQCFRRWVCEVILFVFSLTLVAPMWVATGLYEVLLEATRQSPDSPPTGMLAVVGQLADKLPSYFLLVWNSLVLPCLIDWENRLARPHLRSRSEASQFSSNLVYMVLSSLLVPMLGLLATDQSMLDQWIKYMTRLKQEDAREVLQTLGEQTLAAPSEQFLKYAINAAFVTSGCQLLQLGKKATVWLCRWPGDAWPFPWGYWYAWAMSILVVSLSLSVLMPAQLWAAALFFFLMYKVHKENLERGVFETFEMDRRAEIAIACWMFNGVAAFWCLMGFFFYSQPTDGADGFISLPSLDLSGGGRGDQVLLPHTAIRVSLHTVVFCALLALSALLWVASAFLAKGTMEVRVWRRFGDGGQQAVVFLARAVGGMLFVAALAFGPGSPAKWVRVSVHHAAAFTMWLLSLLALGLSLAARFWAKRRAKSRISVDLHSLFSRSGVVDIEELMREEGMEGMKDLYSDCQFGRMQSNLM